MKEFELKYGCNPNQKPAKIYMADGSELPITILNGRPGYINFLDALNSWQLVKELKEATGMAAVTSFKHVSPTSAAVGKVLPKNLKKACFVDDVPELDDSPLACAYARARGTDRMCSFGDWVALSDVCDVTTAKLIAREVSDGVIAPGYSEEALAILKTKRKGGYNVVAIDPDYVPAEQETKQIFGITFQQGRKPKNTWLAGKIKCGHCGYALKATHVPNSTGYFRCTKRTENKGCPGCGKIRKEEFEQFIFSAMQEKFKDFQILHGREEKVNPKLTAYQVELAQVEAEIEKLLDTLTGANATLLAYANKKIEELDTRRQTISKAIAELSVETISPQQIKKLSYYLDNWDSIDFDDKRKAADGLISTIKATSDRVQIEWKI